MKSCWSSYSHHWH